ncbi:MAG: DNA primase [Defluviitaleaceae bacterium]|nr:DNA primase [Defluviitaleaceae bacterium]
MKRNFPFTIRQVAKILDLKIRYDNQENGNLDVDCPFCKKKSKLNLNAAENIYRCNYCDEKGGMVVLYAKIIGVSNAVAYREICEILGSSGKLNMADCDDASPLTASRADADTVHQTYFMLFSMLSLAKPHRDELLERGLSDEQIDSFNFKSVPAFGQQSLCAKLLQSGCTLEGVPGFYKENDQWNVKLKAPGILLPVCGIDGKIAGLQVRLSNPVNGRKYIWVSSVGLESGTSSGAPVHFVGDPTAKRIYVTDGPLKGTVAHVLSGHTFVCLPGIKSLSGLDNLLLCLKANGTTEVIEAFNLNKLTDKQTGESAAKLREKAQIYGFKVTSAVWGDKSLGSVDEYFLHRAREKKNHVYNVDINAAVAV